MTRTTSRRERRSAQRDASTETSPTNGQRLTHRESAELQTICVVGLGYVGLPLAVEFAQSRHRTIGFDIDERKVAALEGGEDPTGDLESGTIDTADISFTTDSSVIGEADFVIVTVPTPVDEDEQPNLEYVEAAGRTIGNALSPDTTVILESTVYPGATREVFIPAIEASSELASPDAFGVGYSPERISPGDGDRGLTDVVKIVSGQTPEIRAEIAALYESIVTAGVHHAPSIEVAEAAKVVENVQRDLNIAFVNELSMALERMDAELDTHDVLEAAGTKWNFHDYRPGLVGGHCIPVDPYFLSQCSKRAGFVPELMLRGRQVNEAVPEHVAQLTLKALAHNGKSLQDARVLLLGLTYKANVPDVRTSKAGDVADHLRQYGIEVVGFDPVGHVAEMRDALDLEIEEALSFEGIDGVILATNHDAFDSIDPTVMAGTLEPDPVLVDVPAAFDPDGVRRAGITYRRL